MPLSPCLLVVLKLVSKAFQLHSSNPNIKYIMFVYQCLIYYSIILWEPNKHRSVFVRLTLHRGCTFYDILDAQYVLKALREFYAGQ